MSCKRNKLRLFEESSSRHRTKRDTDDSPLDKTTQGLILPFPFDTAKSRIMGLLQATCIMPNSSCSLFSSRFILVIQSSSSSQQGKRTPVWVPSVWVSTSIHEWPLTSSGRRWGSGDEDRGAEERRGEDPCDSVQMERLVVIPLIQTIMWSHHWH